MKLLIRVVAALAAITVTQLTPAHADDMFVECPGGGVGIGTTVTSCAFAASVKQAYLASGRMPVFNAESPETGQVYTMHCTPGFLVTLDDGQTRNTVRCVGGNDAVVVVI